MAHLQKFTAKDLGGLYAHIKRTKDDTPNIIHPERSAENMYLRSKFTGGLPPIEYYKKRMTELEHSTRKDLKSVCSWVITLPAELKNAAAAEQKKFFTAAAEFLNEVYGEENLIACSLHFDETTPHMHYIFIPVKDKKVCAKEVLNKKHLQSFHKTLSDALKTKLGYRVSVETGKTASNKTINQLKNEEIISLRSALNFYKQTAILLRAKISDEDVMKNTTEEKKRLAEKELEVQFSKSNRARKPGMIKVKEQNIFEKSNILSR